MLSSFLPYYTCGGRPLVLFTATINTEREQKKFTYCGEIPFFWVCFLLCILIFKINFVLHVLHDRNFELFMCCEFVIF